MSVYVKDGTPVEGPSLCDSCCHANIQKGYRIGEHIARCTIVSPAMRIPFRVRECTDYVDKHRQSLYEMKKVAWTILPERGKKTVGFSRPESAEDAGADFDAVLNNKAE